MSIQTRSSFIYGHTISDSENSFINFVEDGVTELSTSIDVGSYTITEFASKVAQAFNDVGDNSYTVTLDRSTRKLTVSADSNFDLLVTNGTQLSISAFTLMGFTTDRSGSSSYEADIPTGYIYYPQFNLIQYVAFEDIEESVQSKVNESSSGEVEVVSYGTRNFSEFNIKYATDIINQGAIDDNPNGVSDLRVFMQYITKKRPFEFLPNKDDTDTYYSSLLESTTKSKDGTGFMLKELYSQKLANYFETGKLVLRKITI